MIIYNTVIKLFLALFVAVFIVFSTIGCSVQSVGSSKEELKEQIKKLQSENSSLKKELEDIKNVRADDSDKKIDNKFVLGKEVLKEKPKNILSYKNIVLNISGDFIFEETKNFRDNESSYVLTNDQKDIKEAYIKAVAFTDAKYLDVFGKECVLKKTCVGFKPLSVSNFNSRIETISKKENIGRFEFVEIGDRGFLFDDTKINEFGDVREYITFVNDVQVSFFVIGPAPISHSTLSGVVYNDKSDFSSNSKPSSGVSEQSGVAPILQKTDNQKTD